jgi:molybdopterin-containing oxidoreductase family iron-sulfur binding subunit
VGSRYCANNCPYKVRRFNFFNYHEGEASPRDLMYNPEVTLRSRGVMEKCTFCVQRIAAARQSARVERRALQDGELLTACQQACPTGAIVFGDLNNAESRVHRLTERRRGYRVIEEVGTRPAVTYLAKIRNPNPDVKA